MVNARFGLHGNPSNIYWDKRSQPAHFAQHRPTLHIVGPDRGAIDRRSCRAEPGEPQRYAAKDQHGDGYQHNSADHFVACV